MTAAPSADVIDHLLSSGCVGIFAFALLYAILL